MTTRVGQLNAPVEKQSTPVVRVQARVAKWHLSTLVFWVLLFGLSLSLRLVQADTLGIWQDEGLTLYQVRLPFEQILENRIPVAQFNTQNTVPPLYFLALGAWGRGLGYELWALRIFSVFCALLVSVLLYRAGTWMDGPRTGRIAALLGALSPLYLWYAQELRMYAFLLVLVTFSFVLLWRWYIALQNRDRAWTWALAYALTAAAIGWTHYLAFFLLGAQALWLGVILLRRKPLLLILSGVIGLGLAYPLIPYAVRRFLYGEERDFTFMPLGTIASDLLQSIAFGLPFVVRRPIEDVRQLFPLALLLLALGVWQAWRRGRWALVTLLVGGLVLPVLILYGLSYYKPLYQNARHLIFVSPAFYLLWALGLNRLAEMRRWLPLLVIPFLAYSWGLNVDRYFKDEDPVPRKNDLVPLFEYIGDRYVPGDVVALNDPVLQHTFEYLVPGVPWVVLPPFGVGLEDAVAVPAYEQVAQQYERIWYVYGPPDSGANTWEHAYNWFYDHYPRIAYNEFRGQTRIGVVLFDTQGPSIQNEPYLATVPATVRFPETIQYLGLYKPLESVAAGRRTVVETLWTVEQQPAQDLQMVLRLSDGVGRIWHQEQFVPFGGLHVTSHWLPENWLRVPLFPTIPETLPPGEYQLELYLATSSGEPRFPEGTDQPVAAGTLEVTRAIDPVRMTEGVVVGDALRVKVEPLPSELHPFTSLPLRVQVRVEGAGVVPDTFRLEARSGETVWTETLLIADGLPKGRDGAPMFPPDVWQPGDLLQLAYDVSLPPEIAGETDLELSFYRGEELIEVQQWWGLRQKDALPLGTLTVEPRPLRTEAPALRYPVTGEWGGTVRLLGYNLEPDPVAATQPLQFQLAWQAIAPTAEPYKVFLQLLDEQGAFVVGADTFFDVPSDAWQSGEIILSDHRFEADSIPAGRYTVVAGLYLESTLERLPVNAPNNALPIGALDVVP